ncbi:MAG: histidine phosphatase family protein [Bacteroidales bacterium]|nr:histidine phosphatase family protein [Bacteroidales bacterium]
MKTLYILRHAKSSWASVEQLPDHERPLLEEGKKRTRKLINYLLQNEIKPELIVSSTAKRASETAGYIASALAVDHAQIKLVPSLYNAGSEHIFNQFIDLDDSMNSLMIVGHNPSLTNFVNHWLKPQIDWLPTSGLVGIEFDTAHWEELPKANAKVKFMVYPKLLKGQ